MTKLPFKDILSYTFKGEKDATAMYMFLYENVPMSYAKEKFEQFIEIEKSHDEKIYKIFKALFPTEEPREFDLKSWSRIFIEREHKLKTVRDYLKVLEIAMEAERLSEEVYMFLKKHVNDPDHKKIFLELAHDEREHYNFVAKEYDFYSKVEAEKELQELIRELIKDREAQSKTKAEL